MRSQQAAPGDLDPSFGTGGKVTTDFGALYSDIGRALAIQPDGKLVAAGYVLNFNDSDFALARYDPDGTLDTTFGSGGKGKVSGQMAFPVMEMAM